MYTMRENCHDVFYIIIVVAMCAGLMLSCLSVATDLLEVTKHLTCMNSDTHKCNNMEP